ncbi:MAG TPA: phosphoribosylglycinamide formyltransferase [Thermoplasmata archaeon]|nr:phosphoribosylglycinamide formyltransferase [Thermoplasmata archaeon]
MARTRVGVLASGRGSNFQALVDAVNRGEMDVDLALLVCNVPGARAIDRAQAAGVPVAVIDHRPFGKDREAWEREAAKVLAEHRVDLIVFAGFMRLVTPFFISRFPNRILNIHPSLLPAFPGAHAQRDAVEHGAKVTGVTIHFVDASLDGGPIVLQKAVPVHDDDSEESLATRILEWEHRLYPLAVKLFAEGRLRVDGRRVTVDWSGVDRPPTP